MGVALIVKKLKSAIAKLKNQIAIGVRNARKYIIALIDKALRLIYATKGQKLKFICNDQETREHHALHLNGRQSKARE
jgi:c-di-GMP-binding flagellar brake protein YcgR